MSVTPELVRSKLSSLDSTQESIVSISQWLMFHKRAATLIVDIWLQAVKDGSANRKLSLVYLANELAQVCRARKKPEYPEALATVIPEAVENVFRHATADVQGKITRVVDVWKQRSIFPPQVLADIAKRLESGTAAPAASRSMSLPSDLQKVSNTYIKVLGSASSSSLTLGTANNLYTGLMGAESSHRPSPELYAAKSAQLDKALDLAQKNLQASISLREELIDQLQALVKINTAALENEQATLEDLKRKQQEARDSSYPERSTTPEMEAPQAEAITPQAGPIQLDENEVPATSLEAMDPVARLQMELDPSIQDILAERETNAAQNGNGPVEPMEDAYVP